jgi:hypothetical protein
VEVELHHVGVGVGQRQRGANPSRWADGAEQIAVVVALVRRLARSRSALSPLPNLAVLLADPGLILKPYLDGRRLGYAFKMSLQRAREISLNASTIRSSCAG